MLKESVITIGQHVKFCVQVSCNKDIEVAMPDFGAALKGLIVQESGDSVRSFFGKKFYYFWYILKSFEPGEHSLSGLSLKFKDKKEWQHIILSERKIDVKSLLGDKTQTADIRDIKGPLFYKDPFKIILIIFVILFALGLILWYLLREQKKASRLKTFEPAHVIAFRKIKELRKKDLISRGLVKEFYFYLSLIVRQYLENRFNFRAPEMTTEEFLISQKESSLLSNEHKALLKEFLCGCDLVKFAKYSPVTGEIDRAIASAIALIEQTKQANAEITEAA